MGKKKEPSLLDEFLKLRKKVETIQKASSQILDTVEKTIKELEEP